MWQKRFNTLFLLDWYPIYMASQDLYYSNKNLSYFLSMTGDDWKNRLVTNIESMLLGKDFILESDSEANKFSLYKQGSNYNKVGEAIKVISPHITGKLVNKYPYYIAYQESAESVVVHSFKDAKNIGTEYRFIGEQLSFDSSEQNLITVTNSDDPQKTSYTSLPRLIVRPLSTLIQPQQQIVVNKMKIKCATISKFQICKMYWIL